MRKCFYLLLTLFVFPNAPLSAAEPKASYSGENAERLIPAEADETFGFGVEADFVSRYVWRGIALSEGPVLQPSMWFSFYGATLTVWGNFVLNDEANQGQLNEVDFNLGYVYQHKNFFVGSLFLFYLYPHQDIDPTGEGSIILGFQKGPFKIFTAQLIDIIAAPGAYFGLVGGSFEKELHSKLSLKTSVGVGWANGKFNEANFEVPMAKANVFVWNLDLNWYIHDPFYLRPHMKVTTLLSSDLRDSVEDPTIVSGGLALGVEF